MKVVAYPNYSEYMPQSAVFDLQKWTQALRDIYVKVRLHNLSKVAATEAVVKEWPQLEQYNFSNWMKYYESGDLYKYKTAAENSYWANEEDHYYLPNPPAPKYQAPSPIRSINEILGDSNKIDGPPLGPSKEETEALNNDFRQRLISRFNSIEKHLATSQGFLFAGKEYENLLRSIHELKRKILTLGKMAISAQTCVDLLVREAGSLRRRNCPAASDLMIKLAQTASPSSQIPGNTGDLAMGAIPAGGSIPQGLGNLGTPDPNLNTAPPGAAEPEKTPASGIEGFLNNLKDGGLTDGDELNNDDSPKDEVVMDEDSVEVEAFSLNDDELVVYGQEMPVEEAPRQRKVRPEVGRKNPEDQRPISSDFETLVNSAFDKVTIEDLLRKLQDISLIFKKKELNNQLALANMMISRLGLNPYFVEFSEIQQKQFDASNYSDTRMSNIISTLQGAVGKSTIDLAAPEQTNNDPETQLLKRHLENEEKKEKDRKEMRKNVNEQKLTQDANKPELEIESPAEGLAEKPVRRPEEALRPRAPAPGV